MFQKIKIIFRKYFLQFLILYQLYNKKTYNENNKSVVFDIKRPSCFLRHLVNPTVFFVLNNYNVFFRFRYHFTKQLGFYYRLISNREEVRLIFKKPKFVSYYFTNDASDKQNILIKPDEFGIEEYQHDSFRVPPPMHPMVYNANTFDLVERIRTEKEIVKKYRIVFAGNLASEMYKSFNWGNELYINRVKLVSLLIEEFHDKVFIPKTYEEYINDKGALICIIDRSWFSLNTEDYFRFYQSGYFSFCPPGIRQPFCHNLIESMYTGCIPILQYGKLMSPELINNFNSVSYNNADSFLRGIYSVLKMEKRLIDSMSDNVTKYYDNNLSPEAVVNNLENSILNGCKTIYMPAGN